MTSPNRTANLIRGAGSILLIVTVLVAVPLGLATFVGWPLPTSIPGADAVERAVTTGLSDEVVVNTLAVIVWLTWAQISLALVVEIVAAARGISARRLPVLPGLQATAARLVASIALTFSAASPAAAAVLPPPLPAVEVFIDEAPAIGVEQPGREQPTPTSVEPTVVSTVTVQRHDSYWAISERMLGDGLRWRDIRDHNVGRTMPDGHVILPGSDLLRPGWILEVPGGQAETPDVADTPSPEDPSGEVTVERGDHFWSIAERDLTTSLGRKPTPAEVRVHWMELIAINRGRLVDPANPSLIHPGQVFLLPGPSHSDAEPAAPPPEQPVQPPLPADPSPAPATSEPEGHTAPAEPRERTATLPAVPAESVPAGPDQGSVTDSSDGASNALPGPALVAIGGLASAALAVGVKRAIERRRRRFAATHPGRVSRSTSRRDRRVHREILANADDDAVVDLRSAMSSLASALADSGTATHPRVVQHSNSTLEVLMSSPSASAPAGWTVDVDGLLWSYQPTDGHDDDPGPDCAAPLLVTLGQPDDGAQLYLDLEASGLTALTGDPEVAKGLARSILTEAALSPLTDTIRVIVVGDLIGAAASGVDHLVLVDGWQDVEEDIAAWAEQSHSALAASDWSSPFIGRGAEPDHDALAPVLVVASNRPPEGLLATLVEHRPAALAVVVADHFEGAQCVIDCQPDRLTINDCGLTCVPQDLHDDTLATMIRILETADEADAPDIEDGIGSDQDGLLDGLHVNGSEVPVLDLRDGVHPAVGVQAQLFFTAPSSNGQHKGSGALPEGERDYEILVRLLGEIRVEGGQPLRPKPTALLAYIALHRSVTIEALEDACWADPSPGVRKRLKDVMSECRAAIGSQHLPISTDGHYSVGPGVATDVELFDLRVARAATELLARQAETYWSALELVTGKVLTYPSRSGSSFGWIDTENLRSHWEVRIQAVAQQCIETYLSIDAPDRAAEVAVHVLHALPLNTPLTEALMRAHATNGDLKAVDTVYRAHADGLSRLLNMDPEESTSTLRHDLVVARAL